MGLRAILTAQSYLKGEVNMDYVKIGIKMGLSRRKAKDMESTIKEAVDSEMKKKRMKPITESKDITEPENTYIGGE